MHTTIRNWASAGLVAALLAACASLDAPQVPEDADAATRTEANGDVITEYRVASQLRLVKVVPLRGPTYYLVDRDGDGKLDPAKGGGPLTYYKLYRW